MFISNFFFTFAALNKIYLPMGDKLVNFLWNGADTLLDSLFGLGSSSKQLSNSKKLMDYQNEINVRNWERVNAYNSPKAQMSRYVDAGLNPNLVYGSLDSTAAQSISSPSATTNGPRFGQSRFAQSLMQFYSLENFKEQNKLLQEQQKANAANANKANADAEFVKEQTNEMRWKNTDTYRKLISDGLDLRNKLNNEQYLQAAARTPYASLFVSTEYDILNNNRILQVDQHAINAAEKALKEANIKLIASNIALNGIRMFEIQSQIQLNAQQYTKLSVEIGKITQETQNAIRQGQLIKQEVISKRIENLIYGVTGVKQTSAFSNKLTSLIVQTAFGYTTGGPTTFEGLTDDEFKGAVKQKNDEIQRYQFSNQK